MNQTTWMTERIRTCRYCGRQYGHFEDYVTPTGFVAKVVRLHDCMESLRALFGYDSERARQEVKQ